MTARVFLCSIALLVLLTCAVSCSTTTVYKAPPGPAVQGPPPHAPAYGYRAKQPYRYCYYPTAGIYFDMDRKVYFFRESNDWKTSPHLPVGIHIDIGESVELSLETDTPYVYFDAHQAKYPPGQLKKQIVGPQKGPRKGKAKHGPGH